MLIRKHQTVGKLYPRSINWHRSVIMHVRAYIYVADVTCWNHVIDIVAAGEAKEGPAETVCGDCQQLHIGEWYKIYGGD